MNQQAIVDAIKAALPSVEKLEGAALGNPSDTDQALITQKTRIGIRNSEQFGEFVSALKRDAELSALEGKNHSVGMLNGFSSISLESIAHVLLAKTLAGEAPESVVFRFGEELQSNSCEEFIVMSVRGVSVERQISLGGGIELMPLLELPPSIPRGMALNQPGSLFSIRLREAAQAALVMKVKTSPIFGTTAELSQPSVRRKLISHYQSANSLLTEALNLLVLLDVSPVQQFTWSQAVEISPIYVGSTGVTFFDMSPSFVSTSPLEASRAESQCQAYFSIPEETRKLFLTIPLDRLSRALREKDSIVDCAIDLGIALESLLLHGRNNTELSYRFRLRGALLLEQDIERRKSVKNLLKQIYELRSAAVHRGKLDLSDFKILRQGMELCKKLICVIIENRCQIDFDSLELGASLLS